MKKLFLFVALLSVQFIFSQETCNCCTDNHNQFDFWIGKWVVKDTSGTQVGTNLITKVENNCVLFEEWTSQNGASGRSQNYYNPTDETWNQLWLDDSGTILKLKGRYSNSKMILQSEVITSKTGSKYYNQITWTNNNNATVTQVWEIYSEEKKLLNTLFKGIYYKE